MSRRADKACPICPRYRALSRGRIFGPIRVVPRVSRPLLRTRDPFVFAFNAGDTQQIIIKNVRTIMAIQAPKGTKDVIPAESYKWQYIEKVARKVCDEFGFNDARAPCPALE